MCQMRSVLKEMQVASHQNCEIWIVYSLKLWHINFALCVWYIQSSLGISVLSYMHSKCLHPITCKKSSPSHNYYAFGYDARSGEPPPDACAHTSHNYAHRNRACAHALRYKNYSSIYTHAHIFIRMLKLEACMGVVHESTSSSESTLSEE